MSASLGSSKTTATKDAQLRGVVDRLSPTQISGWVYDLTAPDAPMQVKVVLDERVICDGLANRPRPDVNKEFKTVGSCGFLFSKAQLEGMEVDAVTKAQVWARALNASDWAVVPRGPQALDSASGGPVTPYQSFGNSRGASDSAAKLAALRLNRLQNSSDPERPLKNLSVLDLGCNEGYFCLEAVRQGASRVVGIDRSGGFIKSARGRCPTAEFIQGTWWDVPEEKFDVIFLLSTLHYEPNQKALLNKLVGHLAPNGVLVIECGIAPSAGDHRSWTAIERWDGIRRYPTHDHFKHDVLEAYAVRWMGASVAQKGDPIPRHVFHCTARKPIVLLIAGHSYAGKTILADVLASRGVPLFRADYFLSRLIKLETYNWSELSKALRQFRRPSEIRLDLAGRYIAEHNLAAQFAEILMMEIPLDAKFFCVEGEILRHNSVMAAVVNSLEGRAAMPWVLLPGGTLSFDSSASGELGEFGEDSSLPSDRRTLSSVLNSWLNRR